MEVTLNRNGSSLVAVVEGRINTATAPQLEEKLVPALDGVTDLAIDMSGLNYISSAGLRVVLTTQKVMSKQGSMKLCGLRPEVLEVFEMTGFADFLDIE